MKVLLAVLGGLCLSLTTFVAGLVAAMVFFTAGGDKKQLTDTTDLWTNHPMRVEVADSGLERVPSRAPVPAQTTAAKSSPNQETDDDLSIASSEEAVAGQYAQRLDETITGSIVPAEVPSDEAPDEPLLSEAHLDWCSSRYRSYRPRDNSYTPYSGGRKQCVSPFLSDQGSAEVINEVSPPPATDDSFADETAPPDNQQIEQAAADRPANYRSWEHAQSCFARYRSYRPEDNTYQPYGGGPRRQCE
ncbi:hypothetical protein ABID21_003648 [Pseudorhizobium tarimense]|uniref:Lectin-like protein BA14k n=1 Tax=Pseudorhizobium tarimense TaxID=1079109 RepID=A0ABV2HAD8_9HYPH|nr:BA14K family protein [Pseudorhizobium tarimense]MCJ8520485.1 BA14K family protein [Pseudorhizobium tarimense]